MARFASALVLLGVAVLGPGSAQAGVRTLAASIEIPSQAHPTPSSPNACTAAAFASFPHVRGAVRHILTYRDARGDRDVTEAIAPPFDDVFRAAPATFRVASGRHWSALSRVSSSQGCAPATTPLQGRFSNAKVQIRVTRRGAGVEGTVFDRQCRPLRRASLTARGPALVNGRRARNVVLGTGRSNDNGAFNVDFSQVRVHAPVPYTAHLAVHYGVGNRIVFTEPALIRSHVAHELNHVVQGRPSDCRKAP